MSQTYAFPASGPLDPSDAAAAIRDFLAAIASGHLGSTRPSYITKGGEWYKDVSATVIEKYVYDGTSDILLAYFNPTTHALTETILADNQVTLAKLAQVATARFLGRTTSGTGNVEALTATQATALLNAFVGDSGSGGTKGLCPAPAAGDAAADYFLSADGTFKATPAGLDPGALADFAMDAVPTGWLMCYGQAVSRATYPALYAAIGDTWGAGNGTTTFNVPDLRGRVRAGVDDMGGTSADRLTGTISGLNGDTFAAVGGVEHHALTTAELPAHTHNIPSYATPNSGASVGMDKDNSGGLTQVPSSSVGSDAAHTNMQPTAIVLTCIKY
jgi:microcystin-dependent protein